MRVDVYIELRREGDGDRGRETSGHSASWSVLDMEEVLDVVLQWKQLEGVEGK